ncbi:MAG: PAS domain-containing protein [Nitrospirae bacterium]|nr:PAS domain-containing protein [Nitrospirota bacterium]
MALNVGRQDCSGTMRKNDGYKIAVRIVTGCIVFLVMMLILTSIAIKSLATNHKELEKITSHTVVQIELYQDLRYLVRHEAVIVRNIIMDKANKNEELKRLYDARKKYEYTKGKIIELLDEDKKLGHSNGRGLLEKVLEDEKATRILWDQAITLSETRDIKEAYKFLIKEVRPVQWRWLDNLDKMVDTEKINSKNDFKKASDSYIKSKVNIITMGIITLIFGVLITFIVTISIARPLKEIIEVRTSDLKGANEQLHKEVITRTKLSEELRLSLDELSLTKQLLEGVANGITEEILLLSKDFRIVWANESAAKNHNYKTDEIIGKYCYQVTHQLNLPCEPPNDPCPVHEFERTGKPVTLNHIHFHYNGSDHFVEVTVYPIKNEMGEVHKFVHMTKDITGRVKIEEEMRNLNRILEQKVKEETSLRQQKEQILIQQSKMAALGEMINSIAHQWKQPLTAVSVIIQDMQDAFNYGELDKTYIDEIVKNVILQVNFMSKTIDDFRSFLKPSKEKVGFDVKEAINEILSMFEVMLGKANVTVFFENAATSETYMINGYPNEFKHVILNMINNSKDAILSRRGKESSGVESSGVDSSGTGSYGKIRINLLKRDGRIVITLSDDGGGIPAEVIDKIFEPYFTTKSEEKGTGIGLYMSKTIIENNMGGVLTVRNAGDGAEFTIEI